MVNAGYFLNDPFLSDQPPGYGKTHGTRAVMFGRGSARNSALSD